MSSIPPSSGDLSSGRVWRRDFIGATLGLPLLGTGGISCQRVPLGLTPHHHDAWELHYLENGTASFATEDGRRLVVKGGEVCLTQPGVVHWGEEGLVRPSRLLWLVIDPRRPGAERGSPFTRAELRDLERALISAGDTSACAPAGLRTAFAELLDFLAAGPQPLQAAQLRLLLCRCILLAVSAFAAPKTDSNRQLAQNALAWMREHLEDELAVNDLASACGLKPSRFHEVFRATAGETPAAALRRLRCEEAARRLVRGSQTIGVLAKRLRFASAQHFARCFRHYHGASPACWRERHQS